MSETMARSVSYKNALRSSVPHTAGTWRARPIRYGSYEIEAELGCLNGLRAWFSIATVHAADDAELLMSEGGKAVAKDDAEFIIRACNAHDSLLFALKNLLATHEGEGGTIYHAGDIAREAIAMAEGSPTPSEIGWRQRQGGREA